MHISKVLLLAFLAAAAFSDAHNCRIPIVLPAAGAATGLLIQLISGNLLWWEFLCGVLPGCLTLFFAKASRQSVGYGDGLMLIATGTFLGLFSNLMLLITGLILAAVFSGALVILKIRGWKSRIPFLPFMLGGYVFMLAAV